MTDEPGESSEGDGGGGRIDTPGGGPRRVVSEQSVDDILESLDSPSGAAEDDEAEEDEDDEDGENEDSSVRLEYDESEQGDVGGDETKDEPTADANAEGESVVDGESSSTTVHGETPTGSDDDDSRADAALASRIERGSVTGADVRAAEAGEGRESTPDIDEIDLSLDDLEDSSTGSSPPSGTGGSTDGPLAGSLDRNGGGATNEDEDDGDDDGGLFGRIKRLFSR